MDRLTNRTNPKCKLCGAEMTFYAYSGRIDEERYKFRCPCCHAKLDEVHEYAYSPGKLFAPVENRMEIVRVKIGEHEEWRNEDDLLL